MEKLDFIQGVGICGKPVYIFKNGRMEETKVILTEEEIVRMIHEIAAFNGREVNEENPILEEIMRNARNETEALVGVRNWVSVELKKNPDITINIVNDGNKIALHARNGGAV